MNSPCFDQFNGSDSVENTVMSVDDCFSCLEINNKNSHKEVDFQNISYYEVDLQQILLILSHPAKLYFRGSLYVECLSGAVDIHGYTLRSENGPYLVLSGYGQSAMCLSTIEDNGTGVNDHEFISESKRKILNSFLEQLSPKSSICCVLLLSKTDDLPINNVLKLDKFQYFQIPQNFSFSYFEKLENWLGCMFDFSSGDRIPQKMKYDPSLRTLAADCFKLEGIDYYFSLFNYNLGCILIILCFIIYVFWSEI